MVATTLETSLMKNICSPLAQAVSTELTVNIYIVALAFGTLLIGLFIYWRSRSAASSPICWLMMALCPVFLLFSVFPGGNLSGTIMGFSVTGAIGAFLFIWWYGNNKTLGAYKIDDLRGDIAKLQGEKTSLQNQLAGTAGAGASRKKAQPISVNETFSYTLANKKDRKIALTTGDIMQCECGDIWVSSENTNMQMARYFDQSVSSAIRYYGAKLKPNGDVVEDVIAAEVKQQLGDATSVQPATVIATGSGELERTNKVKKIFHVASVIGQARKGYRPIESIEECVTNALKTAEKFPHCKTILFPLLGTGTAKEDVRTTADKLFRRAISFLEKNASTKIESVYFLIYTDEQLEICQALLDENGGVTKPATKS